MALFCCFPSARLSAIIDEKASVEVFSGTSRRMLDALLRIDSACWVSGRLMKGKYVINLFILSCLLNKGNSPYVEMYL